MKSVYAIPFIGYLVVAIINGQAVRVTDEIALTNNWSEANSRPKCFTNCIGMKFVWIPPGAFLMGSPSGEKGRQPYEGADETQHKVILTKGFYMGVHLATQEQWQTIMRENPSCSFTAEKDLPVNSISWDDCQDFIAKLHLKDCKAYRLPTEAEWEYACRAGTTTAFYFGATIWV